MPDPELTVVAEGSTPAGERWYLSAGGSPEDYYTMLKIVHPDGHWGEGGMGGPPLYAGQLLNCYTGRGTAGPCGLSPGPIPGFAGCTSARPGESRATCCRRPVTRRPG